MRLTAGWLAMTLVLAGCATSSHAPVLPPPKETPHPSPPPVVVIPPPPVAQYPILTDAQAQEMIANGTRIANHSATAATEQKAAIRKAMIASYPALSFLHDCTWQHKLCTAQAQEDAAPYLYAVSVAIKAATP